MAFFQRMGRGFKRLGQKVDDFQERRIASAEKSAAREARMANVYNQRTKAARARAQYEKARREASDSFNPLGGLQSSGLFGQQQQPQQRQTVKYVYRTAPRARPKPRAR